MSVYFIHAEVFVDNDWAAEKLSGVIVATNAVDALENFWRYDMVSSLTSQGIKVVIDKFEKVE